MVTVPKHFTQQAIDDPKLVADIAGLLSPGSAKLIVDAANATQRRTNFEVTGSHLVFWSKYGAHLTPLGVAVAQHQEALSTPPPQID